MQDKINLILMQIYVKYKDNEAKPIIRINAETQFNSFNGLLVFDEYLRWKQLY